MTDLLRHAWDVVRDVFDVLSYLAAVALTLIFAGLTLTCAQSILDGTAGINGDAGAVVLFGFCTALLGTGVYCWR